MNTIILQNDSSEAMQQAATLLRSGEIVAFPTDTVYGLGANVFDRNAIQKIYTAKGRPPEKPLSVLIHDRTQLQTFVAYIPEMARKLMDAFWPGPLTLVFPLKQNTVPTEVTRGFPTIGVRMPNHPTALQLLKQAEVPLAAPSANLSGNPSPITAEQVAANLDRRISAIISGGTCNIGKASTIVDISQEVPVLLRQGSITKAQLEQVLQISIKVVNGSMQLLFVCTGNTCRSAMAEAITRKLIHDMPEQYSNITVNSAGVFCSAPSPASSNAIIATEQNGCDLSTHVAKQITEEHLEQADYVFVMTRKHKQLLEQMAPQYHDKMFLLNAYAEGNPDAADIPDPYGDTLEGYLQCFNILKESITKILEKIK